MLRDDARRARQKFDVAEDLRAERRVLAHGCPFAGIKRGGLAQDRIGNSDLADVVQQRPVRRRP